MGQQLTWLLLAYFFWCWWGHSWVHGAAENLASEMQGLARSYKKHHASTKGSSKTGLWFPSAAQGFPPSSFPQGSRVRSVAATSQARPFHLTEQAISGFRTLRGLLRESTRAHGNLANAYLSPFWWTGKLGLQEQDDLLTPGERTPDCRAPAAALWNVTTDP